MGKRLARERGQVFIFHFSLVDIRWRTQGDVGLLKKSIAANYVNDGIGKEARKAARREKRDTLFALLVVIAGIRGGNTSQVSIVY
ncbi:MAG: hypothetical protein ISS78_00385 [Phycisphaerae bacterium]|nr:hypothetical protein [Phycisphaerae bacterium]